MIVYEGKSMLDGKPIVMIALPDSTNRKTGNLIQTYIMRSDIHPQDAINSGQDESICGSCIHRKQVGDNGRTCYVFPPSFAGIYKKYKSGGYDHLNSRSINKFKNRLVRLGSYGDPLAVPTQVWSKLLSLSSGFTGYTHQWSDESLDTNFWKSVTQASVETIEEKTNANRLGFKTYRVGQKGEKPMRDEMLCPASEEAGKSLQCDQCLRCNGQTKNIFIPVHGAKHILNKFKQV